MFILELKGSCDKFPKLLTVHKIDIASEVYLVHDFHLWLSLVGFVYLGLHNLELIADGWSLNLEFLFCIELLCVVCEYGRR